MRGRVSARCQSVSRILAGVLVVVGGASVASAQTTVTLNQPKTQVVYATVRGGTYANTNEPAQLETRASDNLEYRRHALLKFDTQNTIPAGSTVTSATLTVTVKDGSADATRTIAVYQTTTAWTETEVTWNIRRTGESWMTGGGDLGSKLSQTTVGNAVGTKASFDVTALVKEAVAGQLGSSRYTRLELIDLDASTSDSYRSYYTPDDPNSAVRPTLKVTYGGSSTTTTTTTPPPSGTTLRVLEYNVHHGGIGTDGVYNPTRVADWIVKINPDVVSLVEVEAKDSYDSGDGVAQYKAMLEQKTGKTWYSLDIQDYGDWTSPGIRNCILSKYPFVSTYRHEFSIGRDRTVGGVSITVNGRNVNVMSTHFDPYTASNRLIEAKELVTYIAGFAEDKIVTGDFNDQPTNAPITTITAGNYDAWVVAKSKGLTITASDNPNGYTRNSRIDYVFYSHNNGHLTLKSVQVVDTRDANGIMPSDHRPLLATFSVQ